MKYFLTLFFVSIQMSGGYEIHVPHGSAKPLVKISLPRILEVMGEYREIERQDENPGALLLYSLDDRLDEMVQELKIHLKNYETEEGIRLDISQFYDDTPDYTDDFIDKMKKRLEDE